MSTPTTTTTRAQAAAGVGASPGATYRMVKLRPAILTVDPTVQRPLDGVRVAVIAGDFEPEGLGVIHVSKRADGIHHIIDGAHRIAALRVLGKEDSAVNAVLWENLTRAGEAAMFRRLNNTRQVQPLDRFRVRIVEGDPVACDLATMLDSHGWHIAKNTARGSFFAVSALEKVYRGKDGGDLLTCDALVRIATEAWGHESQALRAEIVSGLGALLRRHPGLDYDKLVTEMAKHEGGPLGLVGKAQQLRNIRGGRISDSMGEILVNAYNKRRHSNRLPEWNAA